MNPTYHGQVARVWPHVIQIEANREITLSAILALRGMLTLGSVDREVLDGAMAILEIIESMTDATGEEILALEHCFNDYWGTVAKDEAERRMALGRKRKTPADTGASSIATRSGDGHEHTD